MLINVLEYFEKDTLRRFPDKIVIVDNEASCTVKDVERQSKRLASAIIQFGGPTNRPVAVFNPPARI